MSLRLKKLPASAARTNIPGQHQRKADEVERLRMLAEKGDRHDGSEHWHHVKERRGAVGAGQLNAAIEAEIGQRRARHRPA
jgi:hypothetical protein